MSPGPVVSSGNIARLQAASGVPRVKRLLLLAEYLSAPEALACGHVHAVCPAAELGDAVHALAGRLTALSPVTHKAVKDSIHRIVVDQRLDDDDIVEAVCAGQAARDGLAGFTGQP